MSATPNRKRARATRKRGAVLAPGPGSANAAVAPARELPARTPAASPRLAERHGPPPPSDPSEDAPIVRKYAALCLKYNALVRRLEDRNTERIAVYRLAWWAMRTNQSGLALLRGGSVLVANQRWDVLGTGSFRRIGDAGEEQGPTFRSLRELAVAEAECLLAGSTIGPSLLRCRNVERDQTLELRFDRQLPAKEEAPAVVVMVHDISERVRGERELALSRQAMLEQERLRVIGELASGVAHDLNNTLNAITLRVHAIRRGPASSSVDGANLDALDRIVEDAVATVARLQDFARTRQDRPLETIDLGRTITEAVEMVRAEVEDKTRLKGFPVSIERALPALPPVVGVATELRQLVVNLILNARDAMPRGGKIFVGGAQRGDHVVVTVEDEGEGIPPENLPRVFHPFFTTKGARGTGLGLSVAYSVMARLGGSIAAANRPLGGALFTLRFPIVASRPATAGDSLAVAVAVAVPAPSAPVPSGRLLLIDDDQDNLDAARELLKLDGLDVECASSGPEALQLLQEGRHYQLILCDLGMPGMNGWEVAAAIKRRGETTRIYLVTGWAREIAGDDARRHLVEGVLAKPVDYERIKSLLAMAGG